MFDLVHRLGRQTLADVSALRPPTPEHFIAAIGHYRALAALWALRKDGNGESATNEKSSICCGFRRWAVPGSNQRPPACKKRAGAAVCCQSAAFCCSQA